MKLFPPDNQKKIRTFFEKAGILSPKGKRAEKNRRSKKNRRTMHYDNYLVVGGTERRDIFGMPANMDRRTEKTG